MRFNARTIVMVKITNSLILLDTSLVDVEQYIFRDLSDFFFYKIFIYMNESFCVFIVFYSFSIFFL